MDSIFGGEHNLRFVRDMGRHAQLSTAYERLDVDAVNAALRNYLQPDRIMEAIAGSFASDDAGARAD